MDAHAQTEQGIQKGLGSPQAPGECFRGRSACANLQVRARIPPRRWALWRTNLAASHRQAGRRMPGRGP
jgi:hypothetical protein